MENKEIFIHLSKIVKESLSDVPEWNKGILYIKKLTGNTGFESSYFNSSNQEIKVSTKANYYTHKMIGELYNKTQNQFPKHTNWNRAIFTLFNDNKFEIKYLWDQKLQNEIDKLNNLEQTVVEKEEINWTQLTSMLDALQTASGQTYGKNKLRELVTKLNQEKKIIIEKEGSLITISSKDDLQKVINSYDPNIIISEIV